MGDYAIVTSDKGPIVHVQVVAPPTDESYPRYLNDLGEGFRKYKKFAMVFNTGDLSNLPTKYRDQQSKWLKETEQEFTGRWICSAFVIKSRVVRGVLMTLLWLNKPYYDVRVMASEEDAYAWVEKSMREAGVKLPETQSAERQSGA